MIMSLDKNQLTEFLKQQLQLFFPDNTPIQGLTEIVQKSIEKIEFSFSHIALPYYKQDGHIFFNHLNSDHYVVFIYYCSHLAYQNNDISLASKLFYLNKALHSFHCMYNTTLPDIFIVCHGIGTVLGKAQYSNFFVVTQGCTVGANARVEYPKLGEGLIMYPHSSILGCSQTAHRIILSNNSMVLNSNIPKNSLVVGQHPNAQLKASRKNIFLQFFTSMPGEA